ncbi:MAG: 2-oxoacid:acceptor oxidoreductase family protein [Candidatus Coatesbacteria bacterium]|nr:MAG: 2-oxoacid:acceptor oxidoreductase family protein [Candidatus Coatesbacteria bacterium]
MKQEIRITGFGGQGIILAGVIVGKAASIYAEKNATMTQSYGPEARGSSCSTQVIIDEQDILYPYIRESDVLVALSQEGYAKFVGELKPGGTLIYDEDLVNLGEAKKDLKLFPIQAQRIAETDLGRRIVTNIVMLGYFTAASEAVPKEAMIEAIKTSVPKGTIELNLQAFERGYDEHAQRQGKK